jgi:hypothetical protein
VQAPSVNWTVGAAACSGGIPYSDFVVYGGVPPYTAYSTSPLIVTIPATSGSPSAQGYYTFRATAACTAEGNATLVFRDSVNATVTATFSIDILDPTVPTVLALVVSPSATTITEPTADRVLNYVVSGGTPPYAVTSSSPASAAVSAVTLAGGQYGFTATVHANIIGATSETIAFVVTDASNAANVATLTVNP